MRGESLWRNQSFLAVWGGQIGSTLGSRISGTALPLLVLAVTGSASSAGVVAAAAVLPHLLLSLPVGALVDRRPRRRIMFGSQGLAFVYRHAFARAAVLLIAGSNVIRQALVLVLIVLATSRGAGPGTIGLMFGIYGGGGLLGALVAGRLVRLISPRGVMIGVNWAWAALIPLLAVVPNPLLLGVIGGATAFLGPMWNVMIGTYTLLLVPDDLRGRVLSAGMTVSWGTLPLGSLAAGLLLDHAGPVPAVLALAGGMLLLAAAATASRAVRHAPDLTPACAAEGVPSLDPVGAGDRDGQR